MQCTRCSGLVLERYGAFSCINCGHDPFLKLITVKCSNPDCFALPELNGFCAPCWHSRKRSALNMAERSKAYRERMRLKQQKRRAKLKEESCSASRTIIDNHSGSLPEVTCSGAMSVEHGGQISQGA